MLPTHPSLHCRKFKPLGWDVVSQAVMVSYLQGSTDSELPFLGQRLFRASWMGRWLPWMHRQASADIVKVA